MSWLVDMMLPAAFLIALVDIYLVAEKLHGRWEHHRDQCEFCHRRAMRRRRRHGRQALEATPCTGREITRAWPAAATGRVESSPVGAPSTVEDAESVYSHV